MPFANPLRTLWSGGHTAFGGWCATSSVVSAEVVAAAGYDYVGVDLQHGAVSYSDALPMLVAIAGRGAMPVCRVPTNDADVIGKVLDAGALGVVVPLVSTPDEAARAVAACRYPPRGTRSFGPVRAATVTGSREVEDLEQVVCAVMVETKEGLERVDEIAATPGLDVVYVGPADLALALGLPPGYRRPEPEHEKAIEAIAQACRRHDVTMGIHCDGGEMAALRRGQGARMITVVNDLALVRAGATAELELARAAGAEPAGIRAG